MSEKAEQEKQLQAQEDLVQAIHRERGSQKRTMAQDGTPRKRMRKSDDAPTVESDPSPVMKGTKCNKPKIALSVKPPRLVVKQVPSYPCLLCPSLATDDLLPISYPSDDLRARSKATDGSVMAHLSCVNSIPEVWVDDREGEGMVVRGADDIPKERWNLVSSTSDSADTQKCLACVEKKMQSTGAKMQCVNVSQSLLLLLTVRENVQGRTMCHARRSTSKLSSEYGRSRMSSLPLAMRKKERRAKCVKC